MNKKYYFLVIFLTFLILFTPFLFFFLPSPKTPEISVEGYALQLRIRYVYLYKDGDLFGAGELVAEYSPAFISFPLSLLRSEGSRTFSAEESPWVTLYGLSIGSSFSVCLFDQDKVGRDLLVQMNFVLESPPPLDLEFSIRPSPTFPLGEMSSSGPFSYSVQHAKHVIINGERFYNYMSVTFVFTSYTS